MLFHDVQLLFDDLVDDIELRRAAVLAARWSETMFLDGEVLGDGAATGPARAALRRLRLFRQVRRLGSRVERLLHLCRDDGRRLGLLLRARRRLALLALGDRQELRDPLVELRELGHEPRVRREQLGDLRTLLGVLSQQRLDVDHEPTRSRLEIDVDPLPTRKPSKPAPARGGEVDAREQRGERRAVDLHPRVPAVDGRELKTPSLETLCKYAPARAVEPDRFGDAPPLVEEEVEVPVDGIEVEATYGASQRVERSAHVDGLDGDEDTDRGREGQHARSARTRRTRVSSRKSSASSIRAPSTCTT
ncbi:MAG: hypothetical protein QM820_23895 [Minicystis sp.]